MNGQSHKNGALRWPNSPRQEQHHRRPSGSGGASTGGSTTRGETPLRVHFPDDLDRRDSAGPLVLIADFVTSLFALVCIAGLSTILVTLYVTVRPFSLQAYRRIAAGFGAAAFIDAIALLLPNTKIYLTGDSDIPSPVGTSLLVSNHLMDGDWWAILLLGRCVGLRGSIKVFLRNEYLHINMQNGEVSPSPSAASGRTNGSIGTISVNASPSPAPRVENGWSQPPPVTDPDHPYPQDISLLAKLVHLFLEFPLINGEDYISNRNQLFQLLRSFAENNGASAPVHLLLFPEGWSQHNGEDRRSILAKSNEFARREGRPQLKHLLLPRSRGFNASLECLRESSPVVYDVTLVSPC